MKVGIAGIDRKVEEQMKAVTAEINRVSLENGSKFVKMNKSLEEHNIRI